MANKYRGQVPIELDGKKLIIQYDLTAIAAMNDAFGDQAHVTLIGATATSAVDVLVKGLSIGLERNHPGEYSPEKIKEICPPVSLMQEAVYEALIAAWHGPKGIPPVDPPRRLGKRIQQWWIQLLRRSNKDSGSV